MIQHTVCFTLVHPTGSDAERDFLTTAAAVLPNVPGVTGFRIARQVGSQSDLRWQFSMDFPDSATYAAYDAHPDHRGFVESRWIAEVSSFTEFDFEPYDGAAA
ncbi:Dabb family protein [Frondihabitans sp. PAMC 28766]|uniref:Dabb family protein n=1 Tax=Frondihabitans sp. PAMC 28766 TaxID=1795630 RepID=UPI001EF667FF|nr:Dabb family protein [Frondihabitans sp. PAMC 28766]